MHNKIIRLLCLTLALLLSVALLGACAEKKDKETASKTSSTASKVESQEEIPSTESEPEEPPVEEEPADDFYEDLEEGVEEDFETVATLTINNAKPVQKDFMGLNAVYHGFTYRKDAFGRQYDEATAKFEAKRAINTGMNVARTYYDHNMAWDAATKSWNWESEDMKAFYKWCLDMKEGGVDVLVNYWYQNNYLYTSYSWKDETSDGTQNVPFEGFRVDGDQQKTLEKFADFMCETVRALRAHGCTNANQIAVATEPGAWWEDDWEGVEGGKEFMAYQEKCAKSQADTVNTVNAALKKNDLRKYLKIMGPNISAQAPGTQGIYLKAYKKYLDKDACDYFSSHTYQGSDNTKDNYFLWQEQWDELKSHGVDANTYIWDEYNLANIGGSSATTTLRNSPYAGTQMALAETCFLNNGFKGSYRWSLFDQQWPNNYANNDDSFKDGVHMCGTAPTLLQSSIVYPTYYEYSLVQTAMGQEHSKVFASTNDDFNSVYSAMTVGPDGSVNIIVVSTNIFETKVSVDFEKSLEGVTLYRHLYDPNNLAPCTDKGELIPPDCKYTNTTTKLNDVIPPYSVAIYTTRKLCK